MKESPREGSEVNFSPRLIAVKRTPFMRRGFARMLLECGGLSPLWVCGGLTPLLVNLLHCARSRQVATTKALTGQRTPKLEKPPTLARERLPVNCWDWPEVPLLLS